MTDLARAPKAPDLGARLFPATSRGAHDTLWAVLTGLAVFGLTFARVPQAWRSVWAEDGQVFLSGALVQGWASFFHFYAGYLHFVPRLGAMVTAQFPLSDAPAVMASYAAGVAGACGAAVQSLSGGLVRARWARVGMGLSFALVPASRVEAIANMANLQFFLVPAAFWALLAVPWSRAGRAVAIGVLAATAASSVVAFVLVPVAGLRLALRRASAAPAVFVAIECAHSLAVVVVDQPRPKTLPIPFSSVVTHFFHDVIAGQILGGPFYSPWHPLVTMVLVLLAALVGLVALVAARTSAGRRLVLVEAAATFLLGCATYFFEAVTQGAPSRYAVVPGLLTTFSLVMVADVAARSPGARLVAVLCVVTVAVPWAISFPATAYRVTGPRWAPAYAAAERRCAAGLRAVTLPILPERATPPPTWEMQVPCWAIGR